MGGATLEQIIETIQNPSKQPKKLGPGKYNFYRRFKETPTGNNKYIVVRVDGGQYYTAWSTSKV